MIRTVSAWRRCGVGTELPSGSFEFGVVRRHVDLLRVSSALCPGTAAPVC